jgi:DNA repair protein RecO (recombination protein O)
MNRRVQALVLRRIPYGDTSLVLHVFTREAGRLGLMAKGARRPKSSLDAVLQTGQWAELQLLVREGRELQLLKDADLVEDFHGLRRDYARLMTGLAVCEALERTQLSEQADPALFDCAAATLRLAAGDSRHPQNLVYWFLLFLLTHSGYGLDLGSCSVCGRPWEEFRHQAGGGLDPREGRARCPDCRPGGEETGLPPALWRVLHFLLHRPPDEVARREITPATRRLLGNLLDLLLKAHMAPGLELRCLRQAEELEAHDMPAAREEEGPGTAIPREKDGHEDD